MNGIGFILHPSSLILLCVGALLAAPDSAKDKGEPRRDCSRNICAASDRRKATIWGRRIGMCLPAARDREFQDGAASHPHTGDGAERSETAEHAPHRDAPA